MAKLRNEELAILDEHPEISLLTIRPKPRQTKIAAGLGIALLVGLAVCGPFADTPLARIDSFIPSVESIVFVTDFITSVLLFSQSRITRSRALLALASGYLFTSLIIVSHILTFPGAVSAGGLFGAGRQTAGWLYVFWHLALAVTILIYTRFKKEERGNDPTTKSQTSHPIAWPVFAVVSLALGLTVLVTAGEQFLPALFIDSMNFAPLARYVLGFNGLICAVGLAALWAQPQRSALDQWLAVVTLALISEVVSNVFLISARFTFGWYASRLFAIATSTILLAVLIQETVVLYGRIARSNAMLQREQKNKLLNLEVLASAIRHEVAQPLGALGLNAQTVELCLKQLPADLNCAREAAQDILTASHRVDEVLADVQGLFGKAKNDPIPIDLNDLVLEVLRTLDADLKLYKVVTNVELTAGIPIVNGQRGLLQEVMINLIQNAIDAMQTIGETQRELRVKTERSGDNLVRITIADTGPGIDPGKSDQIFETFFTTKPNGMGLGLALCRMIIERQGGQLAFLPASPHGAIFQITLPQSDLVVLTEAAAAPLQPNLDRVSGMMTLLLSRLSGRGARAARPVP